MDAVETQLGLHRQIYRGRRYKRTLDVLFFLSEAISFTLDLFGKGKWSFLLASLLLSTFGFVLTICTCITRRKMKALTKSEAMQLTTVDIVFSLGQLINNYNATFFPLAFAVIALVFAFRNNEEESNSDSSKRIEVTESSVDHGDVTN
ncbi:hypothetical protein ACOSQ3_004132 [Xanthoceras sorbifolium]